MVPKQYRVSRLLGTFRRKQFDSEESEKRSEKFESLENSTSYTHIHFANNWPELIAFPVWNFHAFSWRRFSSASAKLKGHQRTFVYKFSDNVTCQIQLPRFKKITPNKYPEILFFPQFFLCRMFFLCGNARDNLYSVQVHANEFTI